MCPNYGLYRLGLNHAPRGKAMPSRQCSAISAMALYEYMLVTAGFIVCALFVVSYT